MLGLNVADKYASVITKNLGLGCNSWLCSAGHFLIMHLSSVVGNNQSMSGQIVNLVANLYVSLFDEKILYYQNYR